MSLTTSFHLLLTQQLNCLVGLGAHTPWLRLAMWRRHRSSHLQRGSIDRLRCPDSHGQAATTDRGTFQPHDADAHLYGKTWERCGCQGIVLSRRHEGLVWYLVSPHPIMPKAPCEERKSQLVACSRSSLAFQTPSHPPIVLSSHISS